MKAKYAKNGDVHLKMVLSRNFCESSRWRSVSNKECECQNIRNTISEWKTSIRGIVKVVKIFRCTPKISKSVSKNIYGSTPTLRHHMSERWTVITEISEAEKEVCWRGVTEKFSVPTKNSQRRFQKHFHGGSSILTPQPRKE